MQAHLFYVTQQEAVIPLYLLSKAQWKEKAESFTAAEQNRLASCQFKGKLGNCCLFYGIDGMVDKVYIGSDEGNQELALAHAALALPLGCYQVQGQLTQQGAMGWGLAQYRFVAYKEHDLQPRLLLVNAEDLKDILALTQSIFLVRDLVNTPTNDMGSKEMAALVEDLAQQYQAEFKQWVGTELLTDNFPAIHAVGRACASAPRLLSLAWGQEHHPRITLIGKGVCFDSGGLNCKPPLGMRLMKKDMGGAAHAIALAQWIMMQALPVRLQVLVPAIENSIGPDAFRPGDVLTMRNGLTVEIDNTDAEGRLILADALVKACEGQPELIIDFATLTGAARVALGTEIAAMFSNRDEVAKELLQASNEAADPIWHMPLFAAYETYLSSHIADLVNSSPSPYAGAITAGLFLQHFVSKSIAWVHFDVMAWNLCSKPGKPEGGEAMGLRTVAEYLLRVYGRS